MALNVHVGVRTETDRELFGQVGGILQEVCHRTLSLPSGPDKLIHTFLYKHTKISSFPPPPHCFPHRPDKGMPRLPRMRTAVCVCWCTPLQTEK